MEKKQWLFVLAVFISVLMIGFNTLGAVQESYVLDLDDPVFKYRENTLNDSSTTVNNVYNGSENVTYWISIPKNSTVLNASFDLTGEIIYIYQNLVTSDGILGVSTGEVTSHPGNEIVTGTNNLEPTVRVLYGKNGSQIWSYDVSTSPNNVLSTAIGNVTVDAGNEIVVGEQDTYVYVLDATDSSGSELWNFPTGGEVKSVFVGDVDGGENEVVAGSADGKAYVLDYQGNQLWNYTVDSGTVYSVAVGNLTSHSGNEVLVGADKIYLLNSSGGLIWTEDLSTTIFAVAIGDVNQDPGQEIVVGALDDRIYLLNVTDSQADAEWNYTTTGDVKSLIIDDVTSNTGNETVAGSDDGIIYTIDSNGNLVWSYATASLVESVTAGNVTADPGNEVLAGAVNGYLYVFNFDYFPTNVSIDVGKIGGYDWNYSGKLRDTDKAYGFESEVQSFLNSCTADANGFCDVPFVFHSDYQGKLVISNINVTYRYNATYVVNYQNVSAWSRTNNIQVNESVGSNVSNISFVLNPSNNIDVQHIRVSSSATTCDFNGSTYSVSTVEGKNSCNVPDFTIQSSGQLPDYAFLWDDTLSTDFPVLMFEGIGYNTTGLDNYKWRKNFTIYNITGFPEFALTNVTANVSLDDNITKGSEYLRVWWSAQWCDITPSGGTADCDTGSPTYSSVTCGSDTFWVCKDDTNSDTVYDYFDFKQPIFVENTSWQIGGLRNLNANLTSANVIPATEIWGNYFNYSVNVSDPEGDNVNVTLWIRLNSTGIWESMGTENMSSAGTAWFNLTSYNNWSRLNSYKFEYQDFNASGDPIHSPDNTSIYSGPDVQGHNVDIVHIQGNESTVSRGNTTYLIVRINDTNQSAWVGDNVSCKFWITTNGSVFDSGHSNLTNSSGHCVHTFTPDSTYSADNQTWVAGVYNDSYYVATNSTNFVIGVKGRLNVSLIVPEQYQSLLRNSTNQLSARLFDEYGNKVNQSGYNCTFWFNDGYVNSSDTDATGWCNYTWTPPCGTNIGNFYVNTTLTGSSEFYDIWDSEDNNVINITDQLNTTVLLPADGTVYHKGDTPELNSTSNDTCYLAQQGDFNVTWSKKWREKFKIYFNETGGINRTKEPFIINGTQLENLGIDLNEWVINNTVVVSNGVIVESDVKPWINDSKLEKNDSQIYFSNYTELVFLVDLQAYQSATYWIYYNQSSPTNYNISYIVNGGFENNNTASWQYSESANCFVAGIDRCKGFAIDEGTETTGNYSMYLYSECTTVGCNTVEFTQDMYNEMNSSRIKVRYKAWGEFNTGSGAYVSIGAASTECNLSVTPGTTKAAAQWNNTFCNDSSFLTAKNVTIKIHDVLDSGGGMGASHIYIDYICIADSSGNCLSLDSGKTLERTVISQTDVSTGENTTWSIPFSEELGRRRVLANASAAFYQFGQDWADIIIYGWSEVSTGNISSPYCMYNQTFICMQNATLTMYCSITDANSTQGISDYNVSFYGDESYLGSNLTNQSGVAAWTWVNSSEVLGTHNITCNITDYFPLYYNSSINDNLTIDFNISSGNTTGEILNTPLEENATGMTRAYNHTFGLNLIVNNTGNGTMYGVDVSMATPTGIDAAPVNCPVLRVGEYCNVTSQVNVTYLAVPGNQTINVTLSWSNADSTPGNSSNQTTVMVMNKTALNAVETWINYTIARGDSKNVGNFTVEAYGNTEILSIVFSEEGDNSSEISQWIDYSPSSIASIAQGSDQFVYVNITTPFNASMGMYLANITVNATGSSCSPMSECWDYVLLNFTVAVSDWERTPNNMSKTIGLIPDNGTIGSITVTNNKNANYTFNITLSGNGTSNITTGLSGFSLSPFASRIINAYHNTTTTTYPPGYWFVNLSIINNDGAFPSVQNTSVYLNVINLTVDILSPNQTNPTSAVNASDIVNITMNATLSGASITENMTWTVDIAGQSCTGVEYSYNLSSGNWDLNCSAPSLANNPLNNTLDVTGNYTTMSGTIVSDSETDAVVYDDITPPQFGAIEVSSVNYFDNVPWVIFNVNITDNGALDSAWANVTYLGTTVELVNYSSKSGDNYTFNFTNTGNNVTDYDITVFANDTVNRLNSTTGWFDVYKPLYFEGSSLDPNSENQSINFTFYREGTNYEIHAFGTNASHGDYNHTIHKRDYDLLVSFGSQQFRFNNVNSTLSAENQHGIPNPTNLTNPVRFDLFPNVSSPDISNIDLPDTAENILMAIVVESPYLNYSNLNITLDYTSALSGGTYQEGDLRILYCANWSFSGRSCPGEFAHFDESITSNVTSNTFDFTAGSTTAYALAESCYPNTCGTSPPGDPGGPGGPSGPGGAVPPEPSGPTCGNGVCEAGENDLNCPNDCLKYPFDVKTDIGGEIHLKMFPGENRTYPFTIVNKLRKPIIAFLSLRSLHEYMTLERDIVNIPSDGNRTVNISVELPEDMEPGTYMTDLIVTAEGETMNVPVTLEVSLGGRNYLSLDVELLASVVPIGGNVRFNVKMKNLGYKKTFGLNMTYMIKEGDTEHIITRQTEKLEIEDALTVTRTLSLEGLDIDIGQYFLEVWADFDEFSVKDVDALEIVEFSLIDAFIVAAPWLILVLVLIAFGYFGRLRYIKWKLSRVRYPLPVNFGKIPQKSDEAFWIGRVADTNREAWYNPKDLTTHILIAGSTGAGKSVGASIIVEEALEKNIPVIVFDPTAQWTGFVKSLGDENVLAYYTKFRMDKRHTKPYKGMIFEIEDPHLDLDFKKYMNPGEITIFTMNKLKSGEYDVALKNVIDSMFRIEWEESPELKMIVVFDEVHRLLEKYGGIGGYVSLEKACREFRKWGIGVIMCSQVLADFKEAIAGNVLTDVQLNTKSLVDIGKVKEKYGPVYAQRVSRQGIAVGMIQHPRYNEGKPWFVNFRPPYHNPHKITAKEMEMYKEFAAKLEEIEMRVHAMKKEGKDTFDIELEIKLAKDKLKQGRFRMAKIYIESLEKYFK